MEKNPGGQKFWQRGGGEISWNSILPPPPKMRVAPQMPSKFRDLAPPLCACDAHDCFRSYISQLDNNNTCVSDFGFGLACEMKSKFFYRHYLILLYDYCIKKNIAKSLILKKLFKRECFRGRLELLIKSIVKISISHRYYFAILMDNQIHETITT